MDLTTATPVEIDTQLADLYDDAVRARLDIDRAFNYLRSDVEGYRRTGATDAEVEAKAAAMLADVEGTGAWKVRAIQSSVERLAEARQTLQEARAAQAPLNAEYNRRGGWTRAFLVANTNGHVHKDMSCSTCFIDTRYRWLPQLSGKDEAEIVEAAGSDACTICYPSAPVEVLSRPRSVFSDEELVAQKSRAQRDAEKAERQAKKIAKSLTADGSELVVEYRVGAWQQVGADRNNRVWAEDICVERERFQTEQAATSWVVNNLVNHRLYGYKITHAAGNAQVVEAIAAKHNLTVQEVEAQIEAKVAAKIKRESR